MPIQELFSNDKTLRGEKHVLISILGMLIQPRFPIISIIVLMVIYCLIRITAPTT
jgi:hypothetical protein